MPIKKRKNPGYTGRYSFEGGNKPRFTGSYYGHSRETVLKDCEKSISLLWYLEKCLQRTDIQLADSWWYRLATMLSSSYKSLTQTKMAKTVWTKMHNTYGDVQ